MSSVANESTSDKETPAKETPSKEPSGRATQARDERYDAGKEKRGRRRPNVSAKQVAHGAKVGSDAVRNRVASIVWIIAVVCAVILILAALAVALGAQANNPIVEWLGHAANALAGPFGGLHHGIFELKTKSGADDTIKNALINWGLAAIAYLVVGKVVSRVIHA
jgi:hypothetical protein